MLKNDYFLGKIKLRFTMFLVGGRAYHTLEEANIAQGKRRNWKISEMQALSKRNPEVQTTAAEEAARISSFTRMVETVAKDGLDPETAIAEMYHSEPTWHDPQTLDYASLDWVKENIMGVDKKGRLQNYSNTVLLTEPKTSLRGIWKARKDYLVALESRASQAAHRVEREWEDEEDDWEGVTTPYRQTVKRSQETNIVSKYAFNIWIYVEGDSFEPHKNRKGNHIGSDEFSDAKRALTSASNKGYLAILLPREINQKNYNLWELHPDAKVWVPVIYKQNHLGHSKEENATRLLEIWEGKHNIQTRISDKYEEDPEIPADAYQPRGAPWG